MEIVNSMEIKQVCHKILTLVRDKAREEINPLLIRIQHVIYEMLAHIDKLESENSDVKKLKYHWSVLYRDGDVLEEMGTLIKNTTPVFIEKEIDFISQSLVLSAPIVIQSFGRIESLFIITPKFQEMSGLW